MYNIYHRRPNVGIWRQILNIMHHLRQPVFHKTKRQPLGSIKWRYCPSGIVFNLRNSCSGS